MVQTQPLTIRFESEENTKLLDAIDSKASFDEEKRKKPSTIGKSMPLMKRL